MSTTRPPDAVRHGSGAPDRPYHPGLDGLRGVAVVLVLLYHGDVGVAEGGFLGVSVFFTLSGYLIASLLLDERGATGSIDLRRFWSRRARRLLPALGGSLLLAVGYTIAAGEPDQLTALRGDVVASLAYVTNWRVVAAGQSYADWFVAPSPVLHLWSLAIEEQFYLVFPPVLALVLRRWSLRTVAGVVCGLVAASTLTAAALHQPGLDVTRAYVGTDARAAELLVGVLLAMMLGARPRRPSRPVGRLVGAGGIVGAVALAIVVTRAGVASPWLYRGGLLATAIATALVILAVVHEAGPVARVLTWRPLRLVGLVSYGTYLYHWPIFLWLDGTRTDLSPVPLLALRSALSVGLAVVSYVLLERPVRLGHLVPTRAAPAVLVVATTALLAGTVVGTVGARPSLLVEAAARDDGPPPIPPPRRPPAADGSTGSGAAPSPTTDRPTPPATTTPGSGGDGDADEVPPTPEPLPEPPVTALLPPPEHDPVRILVVGDSVATTLGEGLEAWAEDHGGAVVWPTWRFGCGIVRGGRMQLASGLGIINEDCDRWDEVWSEHLDRFDPDVVVVLSGVWDLTDREHERWDGLRAIGDPVYDRYLLDEYSAAVDLLSSEGAGVVWLTAPCVGDRRLPGPLSGTRAFDADRVVDLNRRIVPRLLASRPAAVVGIDLYEQLCPDDRFERSYRDVVDARPDGLHFEREGASAIADWLMPQLLERPDADALVPPAPQPRGATP